MIAQSSAPISVFRVRGRRHIYLFDEWLSRLSSHIQATIPEWQLCEYTRAATTASDTFVSSAIPGDRGENRDTNNIVAEYLLDWRGILRYLGRNITIMLVQPLFRPRKPLLALPVFVFSGRSLSTHLHLHAITILHFGGLSPPFLYFRFVIGSRRKSLVSSRCFYVSFISQKFIAQSFLFY